MSVLWEHLCWGDDGVGLEHLTYDGNEADAVIVWLDSEGGPCRLSYGVAWDADWVFRRIRIELRSPEGKSELELTRASDGNWSRNGAKSPELEGCSEVDLWPTPFTNTLPIRRLKLDSGTSADIRVAHIVAPELTVTPRPQRYSRIGEALYRFESLDDGFTADLTFDEEGLLVDYPGLFRRRHR